MEIIRHKHQLPNVGKVERTASVAAGVLLIGKGLRNKGWTGTAMALLGAEFLRRGITGNCHSYQALGINTADAEKRAAENGGDSVSVPHGSGIRIDEAITINRSRADVYSFWRDLANIAEFMEYVESVRILGDTDNRMTRWSAKGPGGKCLEWDAEIINEKENELIAWRTLDAAEVANAGSVHFKDGPAGRGTEISLEILYSPPGGSLGAFAAKLFGDDPAARIHSDLKRIKARLEAGVLAGTDGQSKGPKVQGEETAERQIHVDAVSKASEESFPASDAPGFTH
ncbi:MAG TPA: SRPBCC family protein [Bryobacteraceae bacterium]|nr:SRPBCC family protein [Bryobacteraceae bacterium]